MGKTPTVSDMRRVRQTADEALVAIKRIRNEEGYVQREAQKYNWLTAETVFGAAAARPDPTYLKRKGSQSLIYYATDTGVLSAWNGSAWKSTTLT